MQLNNNYVKSENTKKLLETVLLSIKSDKNIRLSENEQRGNNKQHHYIESTRINIREKIEKINSFFVKITQTKISRFFGAKYSYMIEVECREGSYDKYTIKTEDYQQLIKEIYDFLIDIEKSRKIEETNNTLEKIIGDISTTVEKSVKRDDKLDELLNN